MPMPNDDTILAAPRSAWRRQSAALALAVATGAVYLLTLLPGVGAGDAAQLQYMSARMGISHAPGYAIQAAFGKLVTLLPLGPGVAWRVNFMMAVSGVVGCLALYGALHRLTHRPLAAALGAAILGFSSIYWSYAIAAEVYVFHGAFLLIAVYALVRFAKSDRARWLYVAALALGTAVAGRPSEATILPAFALVLLALRGSVTLRLRRIAGAAALAALPFALSVGLFLLRGYPTYMPTEEAPTLASEILGEEPWSTAETPLERIGEAVLYCLGLRWAGMVEGDPLSQRIASGIPRYLHLLSGRALLGRRGPPSPFELEGGVGASIGPLGLALAVLGATFWWRSRWAWLGLGLFAGNAVFYLWYQTYEAPTYTVPGLAGLAFLAGLGSAGPPGASRRERGVLVGLGLLAVAMLLVGNYRLVDRSGSLEPLGRPHMSVAELQRFPARSRLVMDHWHAQTYQYLLHIEAARTDVQVVATDLGGVAHWDRIVAVLAARGHPTWIFAAEGLGLDPRAVRIYRQRTPPAFSRYGFLLAHDPSRGRPPAQDDRPLEGSAPRAERPLLVRGGPR